MERGDGGLTVLSVETLRRTFGGTAARA